jgi:hypothetical protein
MKLTTKGAIAGGLMLLMVPAAAMAQGPCYSYRRYAPGAREMRYDRRDIHNEWRDVARDRYQLRQDVAEGRYRAARAQECDIRRDMANIRGDQVALRRDYRGYPY